MCQDAGFCFHCCYIRVCRTRSGSRRGEYSGPGRWHGSGASLGSGARWWEGPDTGAAGSRAPGWARSAVRPRTLCCLLCKYKSEWPIKYTTVINWPASTNSKQHINAHTVLSGALGGATVSDGVSENGPVFSHGAAAAQTVILNPYIVKVMKLRDQLPHCSPISIVWRLGRGSTAKRECWGQKRDQRREQADCDWAVHTFSLIVCSLLCT